MAKYAFQLCPGGGRSTCIEVGNLLPSLGDVIRAGNGNYYVYNGGGTCGSSTQTWDSSGYVSCSNTTAVDVSSRYDSCTGSTQIYVATADTTASSISVNNECFERFGTNAYIENGVSFDDTHGSCEGCEIDLFYTAYTIDYVSCCESITGNTFLNVPLSAGTFSSNDTFFSGGSCYRVTKIISPQTARITLPTVDFFYNNDAACSKCISANPGSACSTTPSPTPTQTSTPSVTPAVSTTPSPTPSQTPTPTPTPSTSNSNTTIIYNATKCCPESSGNFAGARIRITWPGTPPTLPAIIYSTQGGECYTLNSTTSTVQNFSLTNPTVYTTCDNCNKSQ